MTNSIKHSGQVFTPDYLVNLILDEAGYVVGPSILQKHCIDNSCGDGAFLCEIIRRYCTAYLQKNGSLQGVDAEIATYIHGIEIDQTAFNCCIENLKSITAELGINSCRFDILHGNTLSVNRFDGKMDYVIGNPPYVRVHNLEDSFDSVKSFSFANGGMTDLYLVFFEIGLKMLTKGGKLCYITPSSWTNSIAGQVMRQNILFYRNLISVIDLEHFQPFKATTYTMISLFEKGARNNSFRYFKFDSDNTAKIFIDEIPFDKVNINGYFVLANRQTLENLRRIITTPVAKRVSVKNGFATLADKVFINNDLPFEQFTIRTIKASTGKWYRSFFPYDTNGHPIPKDVLFANGYIKEYFLSKKDDLLKGKSDKENPFWYLYGRTQALKDVASYKIAINSCIKDVNSIKINKVASGEGVYSGLYILTNVPYETITSILLTDDFVQYIAALKKYKSGGYYTFNSKDLEIYLNFRINQKISNEEIHLNKVDKRQVSVRHLSLF